MHEMVQPIVAGQPQGLSTRIGCCGCGSGELERRAGAKLKIESMKLEEA